MEHVIAAKPASVKQLTAHAPFATTLADARRPSATVEQNVSARRRVRVKRAKREGLQKVDFLYLTVFSNIKNILLKIYSVYNFNTIL